MRLLLDTHVLLWAIADDVRLRPEARIAIADGRVPVLVSAVSVWEITIKRALGKLRAPDDLVGQIVAARFETMDITIEHALAVGELPDLHRDPFDRLLVAQAIVEDLTIVSHDAQITKYDVAVLHT